MSTRWTRSEGRSASGSVWRRGVGHTDKESVAKDLVDANELTVCELGAGRVELPELTGHNSQGEQTVVGPGRRFPARPGAAWCRRAVPGAGAKR